MTSRDDDLEDMATIVGHGLNWESIEDELKSQSEYWKLLPRHSCLSRDLQPAAFFVLNPLDVALLKQPACLTS